MKYRKLWARPRYRAIAAVLLTGIAVLPVIGPESIRAFFRSDTFVATRVGLIAALTIPAVVFIAMAVYLRRRSIDAPPAVILFLLLLAVWMTDLHYSNVDLQQYTDEFRDNVALQQDLHDRVVALSPDSVPHCYRFLPNAIVVWLQCLTGGYLAAALIFRLTVNLLLVAAIWCFARIFTGTPGSIVAILLWAVAYPISIRFYAGQLTDPLSHLTFVMCFILAERRNYLGTALVVFAGLLVKETILIMPLWFVIRHYRDRSAWIRMALLFAAATGSGLALRTYIAGGFDYDRISGVGPAWIEVNLADVWYWSRQLLGTVGILVPLTACGWNRSPQSLKHLVVFLFPVLFVSSAVFSWLRESRNFMPMVIPMAIIVGVWIEDFSSSSTSQGTDTTDGHAI